MSIIYIVWPIAQNAQFRAQYAARTNESIEDEPATDVTGTQHIAGSSRCTEADCLYLQSLGLAIMYATDRASLPWIAPPSVD